MTLMSKIPQYAGKMNHWCNNHENRKQKLILIETSSFQQVVPAASHLVYQGQLGTFNATRKCTLVFICELQTSDYYREKKEGILLSPMTKAPTLTEK